MELIDENKFSFCWITDYPMFELNKKQKIKFSHNPFSMPQGDIEKLDFKNPFKKSRLINTILFVMELSYLQGQ